MLGGIGLAVVLTGWLTGGEQVAPALLPSAAEPVLAASDDPHRFENIFATFSTETASLSPDGKHLAYSVIEQGVLSVAVMAIDDPARLTAKVAVNSIKVSWPDGYRGPLREDFPPRIEWMGWVSLTRLVVLTYVRNGPALMAFDTDGSNARVLATARTAETFRGFKFFGRSVEPDAVLLRTTRPRMPGSFRMVTDYDYLRLNTVTGKFTDIEEAVALDEQARMKVAAKAARGDFKTVDREVREVVPDKRVTLIENDDAQVRFLALVEGLADPGSFCVIDRERRVMFDLARRMPGFEPAQAVVTPFDFTASDGQKISGEIMLPPHPKIAHAPVVVFMPDKVGQKMTHGFSREAQAFAEMGLASVRFDSLVTAPKPGEPERIRERWLVDEVVRLVDGLPELHAVSKRSIVLFGEQNAGYLALRAMQIQPGRFIAAVAAEPNISRERWNDPERWPDNAGKPGGSSGIRRPLLVLTSFGTSVYQTYIPQSLVAQATRAGAPSEWKEQPADFKMKRPLARAAAFRQIEQFINANVYQFVVKLGDLEVKP